MQNTQSKLSEQERIDLVANRVYAYFLQIIEYKRKMGVKTFVIDHVHRGELDMSLVELENKYDSKSNWREILEIPNGVGAWHTLSSDEVPNFKEMGDNADGKFFSVKISRFRFRTSRLCHPACARNSTDQRNDSSRPTQKNEKGRLSH
jgi:hypothetical protein